MRDLIDRQDVLDMAYAYGSGLEPEGFCVDVEDIQALPSVQPEVRTQVSSADCISRQGAIDMVEESRRLNHHQDRKEARAHEYEHRHFLKILRDLPPAEPEVTAEMVDSYVKPRCLRVITEELFVELTTGKYLPPRLQPTQPETAKRIVGRSKGGVTLWCECDMCNEPVDVQDNFCRGCGRRLTDG